MSLTPCEFNWPPRNPYHCERCLRTALRHFRSVSCAWFRRPQFPHWPQEDSRTMTKCLECGILNPLFIGGQCQSCEAKRIDAEQQAAVERIAERVRAGDSQAKPADEVFARIGKCPQCHQERPHHKMDCSLRSADLKDPPDKICLACRNAGDWTDDVPFCSSCCDAGWDIAYGRGVRDAVRAMIDDLGDRPDDGAFVQVALKLLLDQVPNVVLDEEMVKLL